MDKPTGLRYENGVLVKYTIYGRKRKNWKQDYRKRSRNKLKHINYCQLCGSSSKPTVHHKIPLSKKIDISRENLIKVCRECHDKIEKGEIKLTNGPLHIMIDESRAKRIADILKGYGIIVISNGSDITINIPHSSQELQEQFAELEKEQISEEPIQPHGV